MAPRFGQFIMAALAILLASISGTESTGIRAATSFGSNLILFTDDGRAVSAATNQEERFFPVPSNFPMTAATCQTMTMFPFCIYYGNNLIYYGSQAVTYEGRDSFYYPDLFPDFVWDGLNAMINTASTDYYLKGCEYITRDASGVFNTTPRNVADLKVPCNVDAGWYDGTDAVVLKGDQVWIVGNDVNAPEDFDEYVAETYA